MTKLIFLGSGSAFTVGANNFQSNMLLVTEKNHKLLIDCGTDIRLSLHAAGLSYLDITDIYISHLHSDHVGGLEYIAFSTLFDPRCQKPNIYLSKDVSTNLWDRTLSGGLRFLEGDIATMNTFFEQHKIDRNGHFTWQEIKFDLVKVAHVDNGFYRMPSYGLFFTLEGVKIFLSTDTQLCLDENQEYYEQADIIFHDCETSHYQTPVHANYGELSELPATIKNKMWLYGYQPGLLPDAKKDGFCGFVKCGQVFQFPLVQKHQLFEPMSKVS
ncbi:MBL fold metallo-hydrolase [Aphanizomenon flos-aquae NRERC-008]|jgi:ribonuclease BN (tRNA processing enzyme)|uniref:MBL fold metallo-hydrolase n=2 Tax=Aphanizomenon flos-aquae TaxID=1176 RepID=A0ABR8IT29_APHFL|nr:MULTISPECIES: MBL fold metallo-hydrolase [Aphanizomenon]MCE2905767.1 MBL fold metallo-hydrolase [Anabaena sp. CoA2_C59]MDJ0505174.1 MBL fold metallo-hydrolase [Nostocales cyanobacterium LE14-WE12]MBD2391634.1 MBL fold metallo-hydrolase [Aphanizomenon flos-aquae FACHB-1171]MBD2630478.1 MBL fold metallo-hydrolase [Aphanizomenon sp. FACHB-1399]MBD2643485.1 MBL fold metallo-hydrolase [Aphanizomenon sp. FACHB-1401]